MSSIYAFFLTYSLSMLLFGGTGITSLGRLVERNRLLEANLGDLDHKKNELIDRLAALRSDPQAIAIEARSMGLYRNEERAVLFGNLEQSNALPDAGRVLALAPIPEGREDLFRIFSVVVGVIVLLFGLIAWKVRDVHQTGNR